MFLKKVKIKGFKSFANTINFKFNIPITAIVGPNGSGKSNVVDAVRWVLGEQSAKNLRGSEMADVIFAGSQKLPAASSAEVSLFLDNSERILDIETDEVKISREVTNDGQSDYLINDSKCRLKDVNELLMDTGLGNNSYSIVSQGKITQIINSKPENLRELFEEAAGISKHKSRKKDALKRLENTNSNLQRIKDLVWELEKQFEKLTKEAKKAKKYKNLKSELKGIEINLLLDQYQELSVRIDELENKKSSLENIINKKETTAENKKEKLHIKKEELRDLEVKYDDKKDEFYQLKTKNEEVKNRINIIKERKKNLVREKENLSEEIMKLKEEYNNNETTVDNLDIKLEDQEKKLNLLAEKKDSIEKDYNSRVEKLKELRSKLNNYRENLIEENVDINQLKRDFDKLKEKIKYRQRALTDFQDQKEQILTKKAHINNKIDLNEKEHKKTLQELEKTKNEYQDLEQKLDGYQNKYDQLETEYEKVQDDLYQKKSRMEFIKELKKDYSGFYKGVKSILKRSDKFSEMYGAVAQLIDVKKEFETAVDTTLGNKLQNVVVKDDSTAQNCINYLKENNKGRATFLPIESIKNYGKINTSDFNNVDGFLGLACDFVDYKKDYKDVMESLLGNTIITSDLDSAIKISNIINKKHKIVTKDGDVIYPGGSLSGGSKNKKKNDLLSRDREIKELKAEINKLNDKIDQIVKDGLDIKEEINNLKEKEESLKNKTQQLKLKAENFQEKMQELQLEHEDTVKNLKNIEDKIDSENESLKELNKEKENLNGIFENNSQDFDEEKNIIKDKQDEIDKLNDKIESIREDLTNIRVEYATEQEKHKNLKKEIENLKESLKDNQILREEKTKRIDEIDQETNSLTERKEKFIAQKQEFENEIIQREENLKKLNKKLTEVRETHDKLEEEVELLNTELNNKKDKLHEINIEYTRKSDKVESIVNRLHNEYEFDVENDEYENREEVENKKEVENKVNELRNEISKLGNVNTGAIEEYEELKERLDYLHEQQDDLNSAKDSIANIIERIDETMMDKFKTSFYQIKEEFEELFVELFNGGKAELNLVDEDALLETGVEIIAQPPGKKLKKLTLLSGGERALTAIALVFALLKVNPSPFYILDEIDAPLDDVNVVRFSNFLREYTDFAQFIVVTHRKHMMTSVDNIYGLTMTNRGVTELVSLNLKEQIQ
ncbi:MAG: chromosome segregation protein SMC [Halanaerobiales bacterium]|nr:chromosome segregation protein SMC [Halanaerobiales bacterium]